jgi:hypothetical protein
VHGKVQLRVVRLGFSGEPQQAAPERHFGACRAAHCDAARAGRSASIPTPQRSEARRETELLAQEETQGLLDRYTEQRLERDQEEQNQRDDEHFPAHTAEQII